MTTTTAGSTGRATERAAIVDPGTYADGVPHELFAAMRGQGAVHWVDEPAMGGMPAGPGMWAVVRHAEVTEVLRDPARFSSSLGLTQIYDAPPWLLPELRTMMINMDPPEHSRLRRLLAKAFTPKAVAELEDRVRARADALVDAVTERGRCDFAREVAAELPLATLADVLGMPESDRWLAFDWSNRVIGMADDEYTASDVFDAGNASPMARAALRSRPQPDGNGRMPDSRRPDGMADLYAYARELATHRRENPGSDIMSTVLAQTDAGGAVTVEEFEKLFWLFSVAGNETVRNGLPGTLLTLLEQPAALERLAAEPDLVDTAVEEAMRWWTPVIQFRRTATRDTELGGVHVRRGDKVVVFFSSANRDERVFADPQTFDITRKPNPHLAFGQGPHFCIGAQLARVQLRAMLAAVLRRWTDIGLAGSPARLRSNFQNGIKHLPVRFRSATGTPRSGSFDKEAMTP